MARASMNVLDVKAWTLATGKGLVGGRIDNVYLDGSVLLFKVRVGGDDRLLAVEPGRRIHVTSRARTPAEYKPLPLVVLLRKHCRGSRIASISQVAFDRIVEIGFSTGYRLVAEIVPRGFAVLLSPDAEILAATRYEKLRDREVRPKAPYKYPPLNMENPFSLSGGEIRERLGDCKSVVRALVRVLGVPGEAAEEALYRAGIERDKGCTSMEDSDYEAVSSSLKEVYEESLAGRGFLALDSGRPLEADPFKPLKYSEGGIEVVEYGSLDEALDELFSKRLEPETREPGAELERIRESYKRIEETVRSYTAKAEELRKAAEKAASLYPLLESIIACAGESRARGADPVEACRGVVRYEPDKARFLVDLQGTPIWVYSGETPDRVIVRLYREAGEAEAKARRAMKAGEELQARIREAEIRAIARKVSERAKRRKVEWFERYHWTLTRGGFIAIGGRDAGQNESIVRRYLDDNDVFLHAEIHGGSVVVLKTHGRDPSEEDLEDAAVLAAAYSRAWKAGVGSVRVFWVRGEQVSKSPPPGEYLARGAFMVYGRKNYIGPLPLRLYLGVGVTVEEAPIVIVGSKWIVKKHSVAYVELAPGDDKVEEAAEEAKKRMLKAVTHDKKPLVMAVGEREIALRLPGRSKVLGEGAGEGSILKVNTQ